MIETMQPLNLTTMSSATNKLVKSWAVLKQTESYWNLKKSIQELNRMPEQLLDLQNAWEVAHEGLNTLLNQLDVHINSAEYATQLEAALRAEGVSFSGEFPNYVLPPFKLNINVSSFAARLSMGQKNERSADLHPEKLGKWVAQRYKNVLADLYGGGSCHTLTR